MPLRRARTTPPPDSDKRLKSALISCVYEDEIRRQSPAGKTFVGIGAAEDLMRGDHPSPYGARGRLDYKFITVLA